MPSAGVRQSRVEATVCGCVDLTAPAITYALRSVIRASVYDLLTTVKRSPGPVPRLTHAAVIEAALHVVDEHGWRR